MHTKAKREFLETFNDIILKPRDFDYVMQFTGPTGTNSVEAALKLARNVTGRENVITFFQMHYQNHLESVFCISGEGEVETLVDGKKYTLKPGSIYILDKHDKHILRAFSEMKMACVLLTYVCRH